MHEKQEVLLLSNSDDSELLDIFTQSFAQYPHMPVLCEKPDSTKDVIQNLIFVYGPLKGTLRYGIKEGNKLVCASFNIDSSAQNLVRSSYRFFLSLRYAASFKYIGLRCMKEFYLARKQKPRLKGHYLEILLICTDPEYQKKGFGNTMLKFLYKESKKRNYNGLIGFTRADRNAFDLYMKHGWIVDKEFHIGKRRFCWVRFVV